MKRAHTRSHLAAAMKLGASRSKIFYVQAGGLLVSGLLWWVVHFMRGDAELPGVLELWTMKIHGALAMSLLFFAGTMFFDHMVHAWQLGRNRRAGIGLAVCLGALVVSGYGLYYFDGDVLRQATEWMHWLSGAVAPAVLWWHIGAGRRSVRSIRDEVMHKHALSRKVRLTEPGKTHVLRDTDGIVERAAQKSSERKP